MSENWNRSYREAPEIFDAFSRAEDPDGAVTRRLLDAAGLSGRSVLEIGCGSGRYSRDFAPSAGRYVALERSPKMLALARAAAGNGRGEPLYVCGLAQQLPLRDRSVDVVIAAWVVVHLTDPARAAALAEIDRVLTGATDGGLWLLENHWSGEFQQLRGPRKHVERERTEALIERDGFRLVDIVETELRFPSEAEAERVLGYLCGETMVEALRRRPTARLSHRVILMHRPRG
jgi:SAM-dependent methyltransferase